MKTPTQKNCTGRPVAWHIATPTQDDVPKLTDIPPPPQWAHYGWIPLYSEHDYLAKCTELEVLRDEIRSALAQLDEALELHASVEKDRDIAIDELKNIANANPSGWDKDVKDQFQQWAQSRARAAIARTNVSKLYDLT